MNRQDWILLVVNAAGSDSLSPVQLQKSLFLLRENIPESVGNGYYNFVAYSYGPFSAQIYSDAEDLESRGLIEIRRGKYNSYLASIQGKQEAERIVKSLSPQAIDYIEKVVSWAKNLTFEEICKAIYDRYPEYRENSVFRF